MDEAFEAAREKLAREYGLLGAPMHLQVEEARQRFAKAPVGLWESAHGTYGNILGVTEEYWEFRADGTGEITEGGLGSAEGATLFEWRPFAERAIEFRVTQWPEVTWDDEEESGEAEEELDEPGGSESMEWCVLRYDFRVVQHDERWSQVAMYDTGQIERGAKLEEAGSWSSGYPLALIEPIPMARLIVDSVGAMRAPMFALLRRLMPISPVQAKHLLEESGFEVARGVRSEMQVILEELENLGAQARLVPIEPSL